MRRALGPTDFQVSVSGPGGRNQTLYLRGEDYKGGERYGDVPGKYFGRVRATVPADFPPTSTTGTGAQPRPVVAGDSVTVIVRAGGQEQRFSYRVQATQQDASKQRVLVVAAEDYTGTAPNKTPTPPPRATSQQHVDALKAAGYEVETYNIDAPPGTIKYPTFLGVLSHFDAVLYYTGDDLVPAGSGPHELPPALERDHADRRHADLAVGREGLVQPPRLPQRGRQARRRRPQRPPDVRQLEHGADGLLRLPVQPGPVLRVQLPAEQPRRRQPARHGVHPPARGQQRHRAVLLRRRLTRQGGAGTTTYNAAPIAPTADSIFAGVAPFNGRHRGGQRPDAGPRRQRHAAHEVGHPPAHAHEHAVQPEPAAAAAPGEGRAGLADDARADRQRRRRRSPRVTRWRSASASSRSTRPPATRSWPRRSATCCRPRPTRPRRSASSPTRPSSRRSTRSTRSTSRSRRYDERGDIKEVRLYANDELVKAKRSFPFQFRYSPRRRRRRPR